MSDKENRARRSLEAFVTNDPKWAAKEIETLRSSFAEEIASNHELRERAEKAEAKVKELEGELERRKKYLDNCERNYGKLERELSVAHDAGIQDASEAAQDAIGELQSKVSELEGELEKSKILCTESERLRATKKAEHSANLARLQQQNKRLVEALERISGTGTSMPPGFGDEVAWYRGLAWGFVKIANKAISERACLVCGGPIPNWTSGDGPVCPGCCDNKTLQDTQPKSCSECEGNNRVNLHARGMTFSEECPIPCPQCKERESE